MAELKYEVIDQFGVLSERGAWTKEFTLISWNERDPKYDIRDWSPDHTKMGKGVTLTKEEVIALRNILNGMDL